MKPHVFRAKPTDALLKSYGQVCGHIDVEGQLLCVQPREHPDHVEPDAEEMLARRMEGAPRA